MKKLAVRALLSCICLSVSVSSFACDWRDLPEGLRKVIDRDNKEAFEKRDNPNKACDLQQKGSDSYFRFFSKERDRLSTKEPHLFQYQKCGSHEWQHVGSLGCGAKNSNGFKNNLLKQS